MEQLREEMRMWIIPDDDLPQDLCFDLIEDVVAHPAQRQVSWQEQEKVSTHIK
jgi:hypothetical protein